MQKPGLTLSQYTDSDNYIVHHITLGTVSALKIAIN